MNIALLIVSSASLVCSGCCLAILLKGAKEAQGIKAEVETVKAKVTHNAKVVKTALGALEI